MKNLLIRFALGVFCGLALYSVWGFSVWCQSLTTIHTEFFYSAHRYSSIFFSVVAGLAAAIFYED